MSDQKTERKFIAEFTFYYSEHLSSLYFSNFSDENIKIVSLSGRTTLFPITWRNLYYPEKSNPETQIMAVNGENTEVISLYFRNFGGKTGVKFQGFDLDFSGCEFNHLDGKDSFVKASDVEGAKILVVLENEYTLTGEFKMTEDERLEAVIEVPEFRSVFD